MVPMKIKAWNLWGRPLKTLEGKTTRPTSDKAEGAMFNMIGPTMVEEQILRGSGGLIIEAVSRGACQRPF